MAEVDNKVIMEARRLGNRLDSGSFDLNDIRALLKRIGELSHTSAHRTRRSRGEDLVDKYRALIKMPCRARA